MLFQIGFPFKLSVIVSLSVILFMLGVGPSRTRADRGAQMGEVRAQQPKNTPPETGWFQRLPGAGDYQSAIPFPELERPPEIVNYWPMNRDFPAACSAMTRAYQEALADAEAQLAGLKKRSLNDMDPEILQLPKLNERVGNLAAYSGDMEKAIANLEEAYNQVNRTLDFLTNGEQVKLHLEEEIGVAYMKLGELQNCRINHNAEMCIIPLSVQGQHKLTTGSEKAIEYFNKYLEGDPKNLEVRWLLNIAYMTLGKYPGGVPPRYLIPPAAFESKEDIGRFTDVAMPAGINAVGEAGGVVMDDFDNDGFLDIIISTADPCDSLHYYHNNGDGTFSDWTERSGLASQPGGLNIIQTDYNNDGWLDLFVMRGGWDMPSHNSLLRNNGDGTFTDVTVQSGLDTGAYRTHSVAWADFDNDGYVDVFIGHELGPSQLFRNKGDGTFEDVSHAAGVDKVAFTKGAVWGDYDNDGYPDL
ncbi:MAG TPA: VCBS repeat-containing protein, partial [Blastocatellia bacterium]